MNTGIIGIRPPERPVFPTHIQWTGEGRFLSPPEAKAVSDFMDAQELHAGTIGNGKSDGSDAHLAADYRTVDTGAVPVKGFEWLYSRVLDYVRRANDEHYRFVLHGLAEPIGYLRYEPKTETRPAGHYNWHQDFGGGVFATRKLSLIIQLSHESDYGGCELTLCDNGPWKVPYKAQGDAIMFPSWAPHMVSDIEWGVRRALVAWIAGPQFQ